jgi:hypothetical protein
MKLFFLKFVKILIMKKLLYLLFAVTLIGCSSDENGFNSNSTLRENLSSNTSSTKLYYSLYKENPLTYEVAYFFANNGYVINYRTVSDDWGNNGANEQCICPEFHNYYDVDDMVVIEDSKDRFSWSTIGSNPITYSLKISNDVIILESSRGGNLWTFREITDTQYSDYLNKKATYDNCH